MKVTKDYYKLNMSAEWLEDIPKNEIITLKVYKSNICSLVWINISMHAQCIQITPTTELGRKQREVDKNTLSINITGNWNIGLSSAHTKS